MLTVTPEKAACGATIRGVDLSAPLDPQDVAVIRRAWTTYGVVTFEDQALSDDDLERVTQAFGPLGDDPFIASIPGRAHVIAVQRAAEETAPIFAENWHSDWSFKPVPPAGTCLYGIVCPPSGGDTLFANQQLAWARMPDALKARVGSLTAIHSARRGYAPSGMYGQTDVKRAMVFRPSVEAEKTQRHPLVRPHPETGTMGLFGCAGYIIDLEEADGSPVPDMEALLLELLAWQTREEFVFARSWRAGMLVMWDNRMVLHRATGGYEGHARRLHRTTIAERTH
ncbi:TauD/TfdA dioxygenase family protein [Zavarzinia sp. CC-PAN008]|uniref:TauD/TfdA dioxygenase family protein n=1 Tax=Zavarzinia sp. CC-PAN008 TaxID=3243332 RepID=UPI003F74265F